MIKKMLLKVLAGTILVSMLWTASASAAEPKKAQAIKGTPVIDAQVDAIWGSAKDIGDFTKHKDLGGGNISAKAKTMWDDQYFYVLCEVTDPVLTTMETTRYWQQDNVEIFIDPLNKRLPAYDLPGAEYAAFFNINVLGVLAPKKNFANYGEIKYAVAKTSNGYIVEAGIPWPDAVKENVKVGGQISFDLKVDEDTTGEATTEGRGQIVWNDTIDNGHNDPSLMGIVELVAAPAAATPKPAASNTSASNPSTGDASIAVSAGMMVAAGTLALIQKRRMSKK